jgi:hypothetical protein
MKASPFEPGSHPSIHLEEFYKTKKAYHFNDKPFIAERPGLFRFAT